MTTRAVVLARYRPGTAGEAARTVHVVPHFGPVTAGAVSALCGALLSVGQIEILTPGEGMPCTMCLLLRGSSTPQAPPASPGDSHPHGGDRGSTSVVAATGYRELWGWPVSLRGDHVSLSLDHQVRALIIPIDVATEVAAILAARRCPAPVLAHPHAPEHRVILAGEPFGVPLPWPPGVQLALGTLPLPPTVTPRGPVTWVHPPEASTVRLCREIDVFAAVRTALRDPPGPPS